MALMDYVIGGMDKSFKQKLFRMLLAAEAAGLSPGITSAFRDDYRQEIASGLKAASDRSYHGGSLRGGYGHGMAADIVSTKGDNRAQRWVSTEVLWKWVDANGKPLGIGRPYLGRDPPHVGPIDGPEYVSKRGVATDRKEAANAKSKKARAVASAKPPKAQAGARSRRARQSRRSRRNRPRSARPEPSLTLPERRQRHETHLGRSCLLACEPARQRWSRPQAAPPPRSPCPWQDAPRSGR